MKRLLALILVLFLTVCAAGCQEGSSDLPTGDGLHQPDNSVPTADVEPTEQTLSMVYSPEKTMNPYSCSDFTNRAIFPLIYQSLFVMDKDYRVEPQLCKSYWVSEDMTTYVFYPEKATFADRTVLTAADVAASLGAAKAGRVYAGRLQAVKSIAVTEDGGVQITLSIPYENLPMLLTMPIVKAGQVDGDFPMGTGPYELETRSVGAQLRLRRNWWCGAKLPITAHEIPLIPASSATDIRDEFELGQVGVVCANPGADSYVDFRCDYQLWDCENGIFLYLGCYSKSKVFSKASVRTALTYAIDRDSLAREYYRTFAAPSVLPASPVSPYYDKALASKYGYDAEKFRQALIQEQLQDSSVVLLVNRADGRRVRVAQAIADMLEACGLQVTLQQLTGEAYTNALRYGRFDLHLGQTMLSPNMDLSAFYADDGALSVGGMGDAGIYGLCQEALANSGNYLALHEAVLADGMLCPVAFLRYAVYAQRDLAADLEPARDNIFYYSLGKSLTDIRTVE